MTLHAVSHSAQHTRAHCMHPRCMHSAQHTSPHCMHPRCMHSAQHTSPHCMHPRPPHSVALRGKGLTWLLFSGSVSPTHALWQAHPLDPMLASCGSEPVVRVWAPNPGAAGVPSTGAMAALVSNIMDASQPELTTEIPPAFTELFEVSCKGCTHCKGRFLTS